MDHIVQKKDQAICQFNSKWGQCLCKCFTYQKESDNGARQEPPAPVLREPPSSRPSTALGSYSRDEAFAVAAKLSEKRA